MTGPVALITGSSRGIGLAAAKALVKQGFAVALNGPEDDQELRDAVQSIEMMGGHVMAAPYDVSNLEGYDPLLQSIESKLGPLTTLVNNAGVGVLNRGDILDVTQESFDRCIAVNSRAVFFLTQSFAKLLLSREREQSLFHAIVNVTSANAIAVAVPRSEYAASKAAAAMISKSFAVRLGAENIAVYDVQPGLIETDMTAAVVETYRKRAQDGLTLMPRVGTAEEVGKVIATLASGQLPYTTGQVISPDAGMLVSRF